MGPFVRHTLTALIAMSLSQTASSSAQELADGQIVSADDALDAARLLTRVTGADNAKLGAAVAMPDAEAINQLLSDMRSVIAGRPDFASASKRALADELNQKFPGILRKYDVGDIYVTTFTADGNEASKTVSSRRLLDVYREAIAAKGVFPVYNQSETGFFSAASTTAAAARISELAGGSGLTKVEAALATSASFKHAYDKQSDAFWNQPLPERRSTTERVAPTRKQWVARAIGALRKLEVEAGVHEGSLDEAATSLFSAVISPDPSAGEGSPGVLGVEVTLAGKGDNSVVPSDALMVSERACTTFPQGDCGKVLLLSPNLSTKVFDSAAVMHAWIVQALGESATVRTHAVDDGLVWMIDRVIQNASSEFAEALRHATQATMKAEELVHTLASHGDPVDDLDQRFVIHAYNSRRVLELLMPDDVVDGTMAAKRAWWTKAATYLKKFSASFDTKTKDLAIPGDLKELSRDILRKLLVAAGLEVTDPDAISVFEWTYREHHKGKQRRWQGDDGNWNKVDEKGTWHTGKKLSLTEIALENMVATQRQLSHYEVLDDRGLPIAGLSDEVVTRIVREADVAKRYIDAVDRFQATIDLDAFALALGHRMAFELVASGGSLPRSELMEKTTGSILHALAHPSATSRIAVRHLHVGEASVGGGVVLFETGQEGDQAFVLYTPHAPSGSAFRAFRSLGDISALFRTDAALRTYIVQSIVSGERAAATRILLRGGRSDVQMVPIEGDFLRASALAFFVQLRNESRYMAVSTSRKDRLEVAHHVNGASDLLSMVLPLYGLVEGGMGMTGAVECFVDGAEGCYGKLGMAGLSIALEVGPPLLARPLIYAGKALGRSIGKLATFGRHSTVGRSFTLPMPANVAAPRSSEAWDDLARQFAVRDVDTGAMHSPSPNLYRDSVGQEYVKIRGQVFKSRNVSKPDGSVERVIYHPTAAGNSRPITLTNGEWHPRPYTGLLGGFPDRPPPIEWREPRWGEGIFRGIDRPRDGNIMVPLNGYQTPIRFDLQTCRWRLVDRNGKLWEEVEYDTAARAWKSVVTGGPSGAPAVPSPRATDEARRAALTEFGISRDPVSWPSVRQGPRSDIPKVINQIWIGDVNELMRLGGVRGKDGLPFKEKALTDLIGDNSRIANAKGYKPTLYVLPDDATSGSLSRLRSKLPGVEVVDLRNTELFEGFKASTHYEAFLFFQKNERATRNLAAASDILRNYIQYKKGGMYLDTDDMLKPAFGENPLQAAKDEILTGPLVTNRDLNMLGEFNTNAFGSHSGNPFFLDLLQEQTARFKLNQAKLRNRPYGDNPEVGVYMAMISRTTGPHVFNIKLRDRSPGHARYADAALDRHMIGKDRSVSNAYSDGTSELQRTYEPLSRGVDTGSNHSWRQTR